MSTTKIGIEMIAQSWISHGSDERAGTDTLFRRQRVDVDGVAMEVPIVSGNALRGRLRRVAAERYCTALGLREKSLPAWLYYSLFCGGSIQKGDEGCKMGIADRRAIRENCPFLSLWGASWRSDILQGKLTVGMLWPVCRETEAMTGIHNTRSIHEFLDEVASTRKDDRESKWMADEKTEAEPEVENQGQIDFFDAVDELNSPAKPATPAQARPKPRKNGAVQMLYRTEALIPGTRLAGLFVLEDANPVEAACLADIVNTWRENPTIGGKAATGFGRVDLAVTHGEFADPAPYAAYLAERRDAIRAWLAEQGAILA